MFNGIKSCKVNKIGVVLQQISKKFCHHRAITCQSISSSAMSMLWSFMQQCHEDAMIIVRKYGKNAYFITMTCNPQKPQIARKLSTWQTSLNMSHLVSWVLRQYLNAFISDLWENGILGRALPGLTLPSSKNRVILKPTLYWQSHKWRNTMMLGTMTLQSLLKFQIGKSCLSFRALSRQLWCTVHVVQITQAMCAWEAMSAPKAPLKPSKITQR